MTPACREGTYRDAVIDGCRALLLLDGARVGDDERRACVATLRRDEERRRDLERTLQQVGVPSLTLTCRKWRRRRPLRQRSGGGKKCWRPCPPPPNPPPPPPPPPAARSRPTAFVA